MSEDIIPADVQQFILQQVDSIAQLEGLLLLHSDPGKAWEAKAIAAGLYIQESQAVALLTRLLEQGFLSVNGTDQNRQYHYQPKSTELSHMVDRIAESYRRYLVPITNLIHSKSKSRIQEFADAFKIRKD